MVIAKSTVWMYSILQVKTLNVNRRFLTLSAKPVAGGGLRGAGFPKEVQRESG